jgi:hypothetical protein
MTVLAGLAGLIVAAPWWLIVNSNSLATGWAVLVGVIVPALLLRPVIRQSRNWSGITALCMIPFACIGIMDIVAGSGALDAGMAIAVISVLTFFAALDAGRRTQ